MTNTTTWTIRHDAPEGEIGTVRDGAWFAIREGRDVWVFTTEDEWTLARPATARTFKTEDAS